MSIEKGAIIDLSGNYRYLLWRNWNSDLPKLLFVMLNPSTADADVDDPTIRRCIGFAKLWGYGSLEVVNLFGLRSTNPDELRKCEDPVGPDNDAHVLLAASNANKIIVAWGTNGSYLGRGRKVSTLLYRHKPFCLDISKAGHPKHPLYIAANKEPFHYMWKDK